MSEVTSNPAGGPTVERGNAAADPPSQDNDFLGVDPLANFDEGASEQNPEPAEKPEGQEETAGADAAQSDDESAQTDEEVADDWLPTEQEKEFPVEVLARYAKRYGYSLEQINESAGLRNLLKDKINSDIEVQRNKADDPTDALSEDEVEAEPETAPADASDPRAQYVARVEKLASSFDQTAIQELGHNLLKELGVETDTQKLQKMLANPNLPAAQRAEVQGALAMAQRSGAVGSVLAKGAVDLVLTTLPQVLPEIIEQIYPGTQRRWEAGIYAQAWHQVKSTVGEDKKPAFSNLPDFGTPEFRDLVLRTERQLDLGKEGLANMVFRDAKGNPYPLEQQAMRKYALIARVAAGQAPKVDPAAVAEAVATGRKKEREVQNARAAGRALGSGRSSRQLTNQQDDDPVMSDLDAAIASANADLKPISAKR